MPYAADGWTQASLLLIANESCHSRPRRPHLYKKRKGGPVAWKISFKTIEGNLNTDIEVSTNVPWVTNLRADPWERYQSESMLYGRWWGDKLWTMVPAVQIVGQYLVTFKEYPPVRWVARSACPNSWMPSRAELQVAASN
jgi:hypothetical protein